MHTLTRWIIAEAIAILPLLFLYNSLLLFIFSIPKFDSLLLYSLLQHTESGPIGLAAYGIYPNASSYSINSTEIVGLFNIFNFSANSSNFLKNFFSIQLNSPLKVGNTLIFPQAGFEISNSSVFFVDNLAEIYGKAFTISGKGNLSIVLFNCNSTFVNSSTISPGKLFYAYSSNIVNVSFPIKGKLYMKIKKINPLVIELGGTVNNNSFSDQINTSIYGKAEFMASSKFLLVPTFLNPGAMVSSPEIVFAGSGCGNYVVFHKLNATLSLLYNSSKGLRSFPSFYSVGSDIAEYAYNVTPIFSCVNNSVRFMSGSGFGWISCYG